MKSRMNQEGNESNEKDKRTPQIAESHVPVMFPHDIVIPHLSLSPPKMSLIEITQLDNQLSNSGALMMVAENIKGDMKASKNMHSWFQNILQKKKKVVQMIPPPFDVIYSILQKPPKMKKTKVMSRLATDETSGKLCLE